jgi:hypothetical protein
VIAELGRDREGEFGVLHGFSVMAATTELGEPSDPALVFPRIFPQGEAFDGHHETDD